jgi:hypothetical protein
MWPNYSVGMKDKLCKKYMQPGQHLTAGCTTQNTITDFCFITHIQNSRVYLAQERNKTNNFKGRKNATWSHLGRFCLR